jgi:hypothetical protein
MQTALSRAHTVRVQAKAPSAPKPAPKVRTAAALPSKTVCPPGRTRTLNPSLSSLPLTLQALPRRRELLISGAATLAAAAAAVLGLSAAGAQAAAESSATKAITAVNRPQQLKKK